MSYVASYFHCVFSTKDRRPLIKPHLRDRLWPYLGGIATENKLTPLAIGGVEDHIHILVSIPSTASIAKSIQLLKGGSSKWIHDTFPTFQDFAWQAEYGAFSVSVSQLGAVSKYIRDQPEHHRTVSFSTEFLALLQKHKIEYDPRLLGF